MSTNEDYYLNDYSSIQRSGIQGWGNSLTDDQVEKAIGDINGKTVLEIGASSGEHFSKLKNRPRDGKYVALDLSPGVTNPELMKQLEDQYQVDFVKGDAENLEFSDETFDVTSSLCVLAHVNNPEAVFSELRRVTKTGGKIVVAMPCDPGLLNRFVKTLVTYPSMRKSGIEDPRLIYAREHKNGVGNLIAFANNCYKNDFIKINYFPFKVKSWNLNLLAIIEVTKR